MSKRFFDTGLWDKQWFRKLGPSEKAAWFYITRSCDNVGVWDGDKDVAEFYIGGKVDWEALKGNCNENIRVLENGKWWLVDYCRFQHGDLFSHKRSGAIDSYMEALEKHGIIDTVRDQFKEYSDAVEDTVPGTVLGKGIGKGKGLGKGTGEGKGTGKIRFDFNSKLWENIPDDLVDEWQDTYPAANVEQELKKAAQWLLSNPKKRKSNYRRFLTNWLSRTQERGRG